MDGDLVILGDVDEIPRPAVLRALRTCPFQARHNCANLDGSFFYYSYSGYAGDWKAGPKVSAPCCARFACLTHPICLCRMIAPQPGGPSVTHKLLDPSAVQVELAPSRTSRVASGMH